MTYIDLLALSAAIGATAATFTLTTSPAFAEQRPVVVTAPADLVVRTISYADLNLASRAGEVTLDRRVGAAVTSLCTETTGGYQVGPNFEWVGCTRGAWSQAKPQIGQALRRAHQTASTGTSTLAAVAITISAPQ